VSGPGRDEVRTPVGLWLVGARGSVAATTFTGAIGVAGGLAPPTGLVTMQPPLAEVGLPGIGSIAMGGHDVVETPLAVRAGRLVDGGALPVGLPEAVGERLSEIESELRPGISWQEARTDPRSAVDRAASDLASFRERHGLEHLVVVNVASTEPPATSHPSHLDPDALDRALRGRLAVLPPSSLYALAAIEAGCGFVDFTPSAGARLPALVQLAERNRVPLAGSDGKTGETLIKTALAPAFRARALRVRSWSATNILGGADGENLSDPERARSKLESKGRCLEEILGYAVESPVAIENVRDLGEWKTAWDHVAFEGFLGVRMRLQFVWDGCDSALAAPLVLDLARLMTLALERGESGEVPDLGFFFKDPVGTDVHSLERQFARLCEWAAQEIAV